MKYTLKGFEMSAKGEMFSKGNLDVNFKIDEIELEGNFEEVYKEILPVIFNIMEGPKKSEKEVETEVKGEHESCSCEHCLSEKSKSYNMDLLEEAVKNLNNVGFARVLINDTLLAVENEDDSMVVKKNVLDKVMIPKDANLADYYDDIMLLTK